MASTINADGGLVACDALVVLSGISFTNVVKVIAAIEVLKARVGCTADEIVQFADVPLNGVNVGLEMDRRDEERVQAVDSIVADIAREGVADEYERVLRVRRRFMP